MSDLKSTQSGKLFQTFILSCPKKEKRVLVWLVLESL